MRLKDQSGFTLAELIVSTGISLMVLAAVYTVFRVQSHSVKSQESRMEAQEYALSGIDMMVREIRNTGYFPTAACNTTGGVVSATGTSFSFVYDVNSDGMCAGDGEVIIYSYDGTNIIRNTQALTDGNVTSLQLTYFPQQTSGTAPAPFCSSPGNPSGCSGDVSANLANIQRISISITVQSKSTDVEFGGQANITMFSDAELRNHGLAS